MNTITDMKENQGLKELSAEELERVSGADMTYYRAYYIAEPQLTRQVIDDYIDSCSTHPETF